jgi:hypothetical protein
MIKSNNSKPNFRGISQSVDKTLGNGAGSGMVTDTVTGMGTDTGGRGKHGGIAMTMAKKSNLSVGGISNKEKMKVAEAIDKLLKVGEVCMHCRWRWVIAHLCCYCCCWSAALLLCCCCDGCGGRSVRRRRIPCV